MGRRGDCRPRRRGSTRTRNGLDRAPAMPGRRSGCGRVCRPLRRRSGPAPAWIGARIERAGSWAVLGVATRSTALESWPATLPGRRADWDRLPTYDSQKLAPDSAVTTEGGIVNHSGHCHYGWLATPSLALVQIRIFTQPVPPLLRAGAAMLGVAPKVPIVPADRPPFPLPWVWTVTRTGGEYAN